MNTAVLIGDVSVLDRYQIRNAVLRIPEVGIRIRELQGLLDKWCRNSIDIFTTLQQDDIMFSRMGTVRGAIVSAVQLGLFDRYKRQFGAPQIFIGSKGQLPLLRVFAGNTTLAEILQGLFNEGEPRNFSTMASQTRGEFDIIRSLNNEIQCLDIIANTLDELVTSLVEEQSVTRIVNVGPGSRIESYNIDPIYERLTVIESIEVDPFLGWFFAATKIAS